MSIYICEIESIAFTECGIDRHNAGKRGDKGIRGANDSLDSEQLQVKESFLTLMYYYVVLCNFRRFMYIYIFATDSLLDE